MFEDDTKWIVDAAMSHHADDDLFCFCPIEFDDSGEVKSIITGMNFVSDRPPRGTVVGVFHCDGQDACDEWEAEHKDALDRLIERTA